MMIFLLLLTSLAFMQNYSLQFEDGEYVEFPYSGDLDLVESQNFSIIAKLKLDDDGHTIFWSTGIDGDPENSLSIGASMNSGGEFRVFWEHGSGTNYEFLDTFDYDNQKFIDLAVTWDGSVVKTYINGLFASQALPPQGPGQTEDRNYKAGGNGEILELSIWSKYLSDNEIQMLYNDSISGFENGLVAYWPILEGSGNFIYDITGNGHDGTLYGATWVENIEGCADEFACNYNPDANIDDGSCDYTCKINGEFALELNKNNQNVIRINTNNYIEHSSDEDYTYEIMFYADTLGFQQGIIEKGYSYPNDNGSGDLPSGWVIDIRGNNTIAFKSGMNYIYGNQQLSANKWYHLALTKSSNLFTLYLDGRVVGTTDTDGVNLGSNIYDLTFGKGNTGNQNATGEYLDGKLTQARIFNYALSQEEIYQSINSSLSYNNNNLIAYWPFGIGEGDTLYDHSGNVNHGSIYGASWEELEYGCTDQVACNFNVNANIDDESCDYSCHIYDNYSLSFDGDDDYALLDNDILNRLNAFTLKVDFYADSVQSGFSNIFQIDSGFYARYQDNEAPFFVSLETSGGYGTTNSLFPPFNQWHSLIITFDSDFYCLYLNESLYDCDELTGVFYNSNPLYIGNWSTVEGFNGRISDFKIWDKALDFDGSFLSLEQNDESLIADWKMNQDPSGDHSNILIDHSGNQNHAVINGATWNEEIFGCTDQYACNFNINATINIQDDCEYSCHDIDNYKLELTNDEDHVIVSDNGTLSIGEEITIDVVFSYSDDSDGMIISKMNDGSNGSYYISMNPGTSNGNGKLRWSVFPDEQSTGDVYFDTDFTFEKDVLYRVTCTYDNSNMKIYVNGNLDVSYPHSGNIRTTNIPLIFGRKSGPDGGAEFEGSISSAKIWNKALDINESFLFLNENDEYLIADWKINQGPFGDYPNILIDHSGNQNHGEINGSTWTYDDGNNNIHLVPSEFPNIQDAINFSINGDSILVSQGTYYENLYFQGKSISIIGDDRESVVLDGNGGIVANFNQGEVSLLQNLTIQGGRGVVLSTNSFATLDNLIIQNNVYENGEGAGVFANGGAGASISNCIIRDNTSGLGGGLFFDGSSNSEIINSEIINNTASRENSGSGGGGIAIINSNVSLINSNVSYNTTLWAGGGLVLMGNAYVGIDSSLISYNESAYGGGIALFGTHVDIANSTIYANSNGGGVFSDNGSADIEESILWNNIHNGLYKQIDYNHNNDIVVTNSNIQGGYSGDGNIDEDPLFCDPEADDFTLYNISPAIGMGAYGIGCEFNDPPNISCTDQIIELPVDCQLGGQISAQENCLFLDPEEDEIIIEYICNGESYSNLSDCILEEGQYLINVYASDLYSTNESSFTITVFPEQPSQVTVQCPNFEETLSHDCELGGEICLDINCEIDNPDNCDLTFQWTVNNDDFCFEQGNYDYNLSVSNIYNNIYSDDGNILINPESNTAPEIIEFVAPDTQITHDCNSEPGTAYVTLEASVFDFNDYEGCIDSLIYEWTCQGDTILYSSNDAVFSGDFPEGSYDCNISVTDPYGLSAIASDTLTIYPEVNNPPEIMINDNITVYCGEDILIDASQTQDECPNSLLYTWTAPNLNQSDGSSIIYPTDGLIPGLYVFNLCVSDGYENGTSCMDIEVSVECCEVEVSGSGADMECEFDSVCDYDITIENTGNLDCELLINDTDIDQECTYILNDFVISPEDSTIFNVSCLSGIEETNFQDILELEHNDPNQLNPIDLVYDIDIVPTNAPILLSILDVSGDDGYQVRARFTRSYNDTDSLQRSEYYTVEKLDPESNEWISSGYQVAYNDAIYEVDVATNINNVPIDFRVIAGMDEGNYQSNIESGISEDNNPPLPPSNLDFFANDNSSNSNGVFSWHHNLEDDFEYFTLHRFQFNENSSTEEYTIENEIEVSIPGYNEVFVSSNDHSGNSSDNNTEEMIITQDLHFGANLVSWADDLGPIHEAFPVDLFPQITGIVGEGVAASPNPVLGWVGSLTEFTSNLGYWVKVDSAAIIHHHIDYRTPNFTYDSTNNPSYTFHYGANLASYPHECYDLASTIPDNIESELTGIIGEGVAASPNPVLGWVGSLSELCRGKAYWYKSDGDIGPFQFIPPTDDFLVSRKEYHGVHKMLKGYEHIQSSYQAFYFIDNILIDNQFPNENDYIVAKKDDIVIGSRKYFGPYTDVPVMGFDSDIIETQGYIIEGEIPNFYLFRNGVFYLLDGEIPSFENNGIYTVTLSGSTIEVPNNFILESVYPNPFNPTTTINFGVPHSSNINISVYNINGQLIKTLKNQFMNAGYYSEVWNATNHPSGIYIIRMSSDAGFMSNQKIVLVK